MERRELIELALQGSKVAEETQESTNIYVDIAEHLLGAGHANSIREIDVILGGMSVEAAESILDIVENGESLEEGNKEEIAKGTKADPEGYMVLRQLATAEDACKRIKTYIGGDGELQMPAWVQAKLTTSAADLDSVADYLLSDTPEKE